MDQILQKGEWVIGQVSYDHIKPWTMESLWSLAIELRSCSLTIPMMVTCDHAYIPNARQFVSEQAVEIAKTIPIKGIFWIDSDMKFDYWDVFKILSHAEEEPSAIIGALYPARRCEGMVGKLTDLGEMEKEIIYSDPNWHGRSLPLAEYLGFGFVWTPIECFQMMPRPWFAECWDVIKNQFVGEDIQFCERWRQDGKLVLAYESATVKHAFEPGPRQLSIENRRNIQPLKTW